jgi:hypothetical protein
MAILIGPAGLTVACGAVAVLELVEAGVATGTSVATVAALALAAGAR